MKSTEGASLPRVCNWPGCGVIIMEDRGINNSSSRKITSKAIPINGRTVTSTSSTTPRRSRSTFFACEHCAEVWYCSQDHQWRDSKAHQPICQYISQTNPRSVWICLDGNGIGYCKNKYQDKYIENVWNKTQHAAFPYHLNEQVFDCYEDGLVEAAKAIGGSRKGSISRAFKSPIAQLLEWELEYYFSTAANTEKQQGRHSETASHAALNHAAMLLSMELGSGMSVHSHIQGPVIVTGRRKQDGKCLNSASLAGILMFTKDAKEMYDENDDGEDCTAIMKVRHWAQHYHKQTWQPLNGTCPWDIYSVSV